MEDVISDYVVISDDGKDVGSSTFWPALHLTRKRKDIPTGVRLERLFYLSFVDDVCRVLLSPELENDLFLIRNASEVVLSYGPSVDDPHRSLYEIACYDETANPWGIAVSDSMANFKMPQDAHGKSMQLSFWMQDGPDYRSMGFQDAFCAARKQAVIQIADSIPCMQRLVQPVGIQPLVSYSRENAIRDGFFIDLSHLPGLKLPLACTPGASDYMGGVMRDANVSLEDLVAAILNAARQRYRELEVKYDLIDFSVAVAAKTHKFRLYYGPHDDGTMVTTLMLPDED